MIGFSSRDDRTRDIPYICPTLRVADPDRGRSFVSGDRNRKAPSVQTNSNRLPTHYSGKRYELGEKMKYGPELKLKMEKYGGRNWSQSGPTQPTNRRGLANTIIYCSSSSPSAVSFLSLLGNRAWKEHREELQVEHRVCSMEQVLEIVAMSAIYQCFSHSLEPCGIFSLSFSCVVFSAHWDLRVA